MASAERPAATAHRDALDAALAARREARAAADRAEADEVTRDVKELRRRVELAHRTFIVPTGIRATQTCDEPGYKVLCACEWSWGDDLSYPAAVMHAERHLETMFHSKGLDW
jgi:hypothetical protein